MSTNNKLTNAEKALLKNGITFNLDINQISETLYCELLEEIREHIAKVTDRPVSTGGWRVTIEAQDIDLGVDPDGEYEYNEPTRKPNKVKP